MCIILDVNVLPSVFSPESKNHSEFKPVCDWIFSANGKIVFGGTKYWGELQKMPAYLSLFTNLNKQNKIVVLIDEVVDEVQGKIISKVDDSDFDDPHIFSIVVVSKCGIVCSHDKRSYKFLKNSDNYPSGVQVPRIYSNSTNKDLLKNRNLTKISYKHVTNFDCHLKEKTQY